MKTIIVGGVAGGASTAARLRRLDEKREITIYEKSGYISYANCGLPYYLGGVITDKEDLTLQTPESFYKRFKVNVNVRHEVIDINPKEKYVVVKNLDTDEEFKDYYDNLVLSPGAKAIKPNIPGIDSSGIFTLRTVEDTYKIHDYINDNNVKSAIVIGGGFVGLEVAENLNHLGIKVTIVEAAPQVLSILDFDMVSKVHNKFRKQGIDLVLNNGISSFEKTNDTIISTLNNNDKLESDMVLLAIGVTPDSTLAQKAGLQTGIKGSIVVNNKMQTSDENIYALGDAVEVVNYITKDKALISLAGPANKQGRIVANNIMNKESFYNGTQGSSVIKVFDLTVAVTGINERQAQLFNLDYSKIIISPASHATYYPGASIMTLKVLFENKTNRILGAQIVGRDGVDKRIDVIATAIRANMQVTDLAELELAYAPPYSSAKDPVNMVGFIADNMISNKVKQFYYEDIKELRNNKNAFLLDARTSEEYSEGHAEGFINIPVDELRDRISEIPSNSDVYIMCHSGIRSYISCRILEGLGYNCFNFSGGYQYYSMVHNEIQRNI